MAMTPLVVIWLSKSTQGLVSLVSAHLPVAPFSPHVFRSIPCRADGPDAWGETLGTAFREMIPLGASSTTLNVVAVVSLFEEGSDASLSRLADVVARTPGSYALHVLCLQGGLARVLGTVDSPCLGVGKDGVRPGSRGTQSECNEELLRLKAITGILSAQRYRAYTLVLDDYAEGGAPINFSQPLLARFLATLLQTLCEDYDMLFPAGYVPEANTVLSVGLSQACFDRDAAAGYLLRRAFVATLEDAGITQEHVDVPAAALRADKLLEGIETFYESAYDRHVVPLLERGEGEEAIASGIRRLVADDVQGLEDRLMAFLSDGSLSLPEKEATFDMLMGHDNTRLEGALYNGRVKDLDDVLSAPLDIYIKSYNDLATDTGLLPGAGECEYLHDASDTGAGEAAEGEQRDASACNPLPELKRLKGDLLDLAAFIRSKTEEVGTLQKIVEGESRKDAVLLRSDVHRRSRYDVREQPLSGDYVPADGLRRREAVDLRPLCSPIRDQGELPSCTSFAVAAMYEMIINASHGGAQGMADMSERFLFYHAHAEKGDWDEGSNFSTQLAVAGKHGICCEELFPYTGTQQRDAPGETAREDALRHRVMRALQIPLKRDGTQYECICENHRLLTSALSEGYAVGFALKVWDDFGQGPGAFVPVPSSADGPEGSYHAMVLVGYSESQKCYIVRNSWGEQFGERGYCYVAAVYVDDPAFTNFACIITETTEERETVSIPCAPMTIKFGATAATCQLAAATNAVAEAHIHLAQLKGQYDGVFAYYNELLQRACVPSTRQTIREKRSAALSASVSALEDERNTLINALPEAMRACRHSWLSACIGLSVVALLLIVWAVWSGTTVLWALAALSVCVSVVLWANRRVRIRRYRRQLQEEIDSKVGQVEQARREFLTAQIRFYTAGVVIDELWKMRLRLAERCQSFLCYVRNLVAWHKEDREALESMLPADEQMFVTLLSQPVLDTFFEARRGDICGGIDVMGRFETFHADSSSLADLRDDLERLTAESLRGLLQDFSMAAYVLQMRSYPYLPPMDGNRLFGSLHTLAQLATRHTFTSRSKGTCVLVINHSPNTERMLHEVCDGYFSVRPQIGGTEDVDALTVLVSLPVPVEHLVM